MYAIPVAAGIDETDFRLLLRRCIGAGLRPDQLMLAEAGKESLLPPPPPPFGEAEPPAFTVPRAYADLLHDAICHSSPARFDLLYIALSRIREGESLLATNHSDVVIAELATYAKNVRRDIHKMHAFLRFRAEEIDGRTLYTAWFEPQHHILRRVAPFFRDRFTNMDWVIATPEGSIAWQDRHLSFGPPGPKPPAGKDGVLDDLWLTYYRTTFNPARLRVKAMTAEMPKHYWPNMPEAALIPDLVAGATKRAATMRTLPADDAPRFAEKAAPKPRVSSAPGTPLAALRAEAVGCTLCPLHRPATQTVFGEGPEDARLVFVGEQPGDQEDIAGRPFVGPAGQLLDKALAEAGIDRRKAYLTNAVKHFKYEPRGKRRIHRKPGAGEIRACRWWLEKELTTLRPSLIVALGATAANALTGHGVSVLSERGPTDFGGVPGYLTIHPSYLLRLPSEGEKEAGFRRFVEDLRAVARLMADAQPTANVTPRQVQLSASARQDETPHPIGMQP